MSERVSENIACHSLLRQSSYFRLEARAGIASSQAWRVRHDSRGAQQEGFIASFAGLFGDDSSSGPVGARAHGRWLHARLPWAAFPPPRMSDVCVEVEGSQVEEGEGGGRKMKTRITVGKRSCRRGEERSGEMGGQASAGEGSEARR